MILVMLAAVSLTEWTAVAISLFALGVSLYGVWERGRDRKAQARVRLGELLDELSALTLEQHKLRLDDAKITADTILTFNSRRFLLSREATRVLEKVPDDNVSSEQYKELALAYDRLGEGAVAERLWRDAIRAAPDRSAMQAIAYRGYGLRLFDHGRLEDARAELERAIESDRRRDGEPASFQMVETYVRWAVAEVDAGGDGVRDDAGALLLRAEETSQRLRTVSRQRQATERIAEARRRVEEAAAP